MFSCGKMSQPFCKKVTSNKLCAFNTKFILPLLSSKSILSSTCLFHSKLEVIMPKFKMEQSYSLHKLLPEMGMETIFSNLANLTKLSHNEGLKVSEVSFQFNHTVKTHLYSPAIADNYILPFTEKSQVLHKAAIEVDEMGTTAAAATTTGITPFSLPRTFMVNRPFFFFIYHEDTNCMLFMGRVIDPTKN